MVLTPSNMLPLGVAMPTFELINTQSEQFLTVNSTTFQNQMVLIGFVCNHCPYVVHIIKELADKMNEYQSKGIASLLISANDVQSYPQDGPDKMAEFAQRYDFEFPYLYDETQEVAKAFQAECTPEFYLFDQNHKLIYRGQFDESRPGVELPVTGQDLDEAVTLGLQGKIRELQKPSIGCNIKWKAS